MWIVIIQYGCKYSVWHFPGLSDHRTLFFCRNLRNISNMCSGSSLGNTNVSYLFLNFPFGIRQGYWKDMFIVNFHGSHSNSFSNDQRLTLNWFQTSDRRNPIISPQFYSNHTTAWIWLVCPGLGQGLRAFQADIILVSAPQNPSLSV